MGRRVLSKSSSFDDQTNSSKSKKPLNSQNDDSTDKLDNGEPKAKRQRVESKFVTQSKVLRWNDLVAKMKMLKEKDERAKFVKILSVNIPGLRALLDKPDRKEHLTKLIEFQKPDILLLQEHKLQESHLELEVVKKFVKEDMKDYKDYWTFSTAKKGYSGVATFVKKDNDLLDVKNVLYRFDNVGGSTAYSNLFQNEGRLICLEFESFYVVNVYVPNSGQTLDRLSQRTEIWDKSFASFLQKLQIDKKVLILGDFNVAHRIEDMHNFYVRPNFDELKHEDVLDADETQYAGLKQLAKQAGCTLAERQSFSRFLKETNLTDTFIWFNEKKTPEQSAAEENLAVVEGCFTYWSHRSGNKQYNRGLRLDYVLASENLLQKSPSAENNNFRLLGTCHLDGFEDGKDNDTLLNEWGLSDHCPIACVLHL